MLGFYYSAASGLCYDARTAVYWAYGRQGPCYRWDGSAQSFVEVSAAELSAEVAAATGAVAWLAHSVGFAHAAACGRYAGQSSLAQRISVAAAGVLAGQRQFCSQAPKKPEHDHKSFWGVCTQLQRCCSSKGT